MSYIVSSVWSPRPRNEKHNFCRNPRVDPNDRLWCYTTDPKTRWEFCFPIGGSQEDQNNYKKANENKIKATQETADKDKAEKTRKATEKTTKDQAEKAYDGEKVYKFFRPDFV